MSFEKLRQFKNEELEAENKKLHDKEPDDLTTAYLYGYSKGKGFSLAENKRLQDVVATLQKAGIMGVDAERLLDSENKKLRDEVDHLKRCKEFESNLQKEVLEVGMPLVPDVISDKTYSVTEAWWAIQKALKEINNV